MAAAFRNVIKMTRNVWLTLGNLLGILLEEERTLQKVQPLLRKFWDVQKLLVSFSQVALRTLDFELSEDCINARVVKLMLKLINCLFFLTDSLATWHHHQTWGAPRYIYQSCSKLIRVLRRCGHHVSFPIIHRAVAADPNCWGLAHCNTGQWCAVRTGRTEFKPVLLYNGTWFTGKTGN